MAGSDSDVLEINVDVEEEKKNYEEENFTWHDYLEATNTDEVPQTSFMHVEQSLQSGLHEGMMLEVPNKSNPNTYWIASIVMACGPLLRLRFVGQEEDRTQDFWCDLTKVQVYPLGWCRDHHLRLQPPSELLPKLLDYEAFVLRALQNAESVPPELLSGDGFTPVDRIKQGMKVEVQDKMDPHQLWVATIIENVGGRLLLRYDTPDSSSPDFWLFHSSQRLFPMNWATEKGSPWRLHWPSHMKTHHGQEEWEAVMEMAKEDARRVPLPPDLFENNYYKIPVHNFTVGMKLEAVHPHNMVEICPASIVKVFTPYNFLVQIDSYAKMETDETESYWLCTVEHPYIFPVGWAQEHEQQLTHPRGWTTSKEEFDWSEYLEVTKSVSAPITCFPHRKSATELGFSQGMKLEAVNPENQHQICAASISKIIDHLLWIHLESNDSFHPNHIVDMDSHEIFPVGWCESNSYPLKPPRSYRKSIKHQKNEVGVSDKKETSTTSSPPQQQRSFWCPKIYFNHKCFSGPYLSKGKLAGLPKAVGPGPVTLVMREVLSMLISVAYKSSRVLKELQADGKPEPGMHLEVLKAKYKNNTYRASVALVTSADEVQAFCKKICLKLQVCPFLFGPISIADSNCPEKCNTLSKTRFTQYWMHGKRKIGRPKGEASNMVPRPKKKRGRKRLFANTKMDVENEPVPEEVLMETSEDVNYPLHHNLTSHALGNDSDASQDMADALRSTGVSPAGSVGSSGSGGRRKYRKKEFPRSEIKTRGAKLPNFALQMRAGHWTRKQWKTNSSETPYMDMRKNISAHSTVTLKSFSEKQQDSLDSTHESDRLNGIVSLRTRHSPQQEDLLELDSNPLLWTQDDVYQYLIKTDDCAEVAQKCKDELIDGQAFMMLNYPTLRENLYLGLKQAVRLCKHIERIKLAFYLQYVTGSEP
ncbi:scm-like with four MBT domains protein 2 [Periplaneta americana]|uniref:scm-like with four MBT domains protein 2 n=1 Tax=Periplaneta americana TaxID=6978 RepID=UPI0037E74864